MVTRPLGPADPHRIGPYRLLAELGRGGMGRVLLGVAPDGRLAAVKQVHARLAADEGFRARFRREVAASRRVSGACTAAVLDADTEAATPWLASVFVAGPSLGTAVERSGALPAETVRRLAAGLATALDEIHRVGLIHRDLKPDNVLLPEYGVRVIDFGIARAAEGGNLTALTGTGLVVGSPAFMSPEQAEGRELTPASDVFSLGSVLVLAATGKSPFAGTSPLRELYSVVHTEPALDAVPAELRPLVAACLAKDPAGRPTPAQLLAALGPVAPVAHVWPPAVRAATAEQRAGVDRLLAEAPDPERTAVPPRPDAPTAVVTRLSAPATTAPPRRRRRVRSGVAAAAALGVLGAGAWWFIGADGPADRYLRMPTCAEAAPKLPLPEQRTDRDDRSSSLDTTCFWHERDTLAPDGWAVFAVAEVEWNLRRSSGSRSAATLQKELFADVARHGRPATGLAFADEAYWESSSPEGACALSVRTENLIVSVELRAEPQSSDCERKAARIAEAAVDATPARGPG
ncbi:serine/threonine-protein kinase [Streptomyces sp. DH8]|uniref:serine/threonine-protein kinase n=1 Tax=Streptomyces sp. DH8 TaxID=2857008 RepID=UPI001E569D49|nr:serine/threonine-protein kinase [Streptomyces sp. DH8]